MHGSLYYWKLIKETRERLHISQEELCGVVIAVSTLSRIENGKGSIQESPRISLPEVRTEQSTHGRRSDRSGNEADRLGSLRALPRAEQ